MSTFLGALRGLQLLSQYSQFSGNPASNSTYDALSAAYNHSHDSRRPGYALSAFDATTANSPDVPPWWSARRLPRGELPLRTDWAPTGTSLGPLSVTLSSNQGASTTSRCPSSRSGTEPRGSSVFNTSDKSQLTGSIVPSAFTDGQSVS